MSKRHYIAIFITVVFAVVLTITGMALMAGKVTKDEPKEVVQTIVKPSRYDIVLECQRLAATTANEGWKYTDCLKELDGANNDEVKIRLN